MTKKYLLPLIVPVLLGAGACKKWLNVQPRDKVSEEKLYETEQGFYSSLNSIYLDMTQQQSYGGQLTMELMDILAQQYNVSTTHRLTTLSSYSYGTDTAKARFTMLWREQFKLIANANKILSVIDARKGVFSNDRFYRHLKGEAYGLRAFLHFDMLRVFGPVYGTPDSTATSIPYNRSFDTRYAELLPANLVITQVLGDLDSAAAMLADDPVIANGPMFSGDPSGGGNFWRLRTLRMNYYAVKALQARVHLYRRDKAAALAAARSVIDAQPGRFPFIQPKYIINNKTNPDRLFHTELLFGLYDGKMAQKQTALFDAGLANERILAPLPNRLNAVFENNNTADYRNNISIWAIPGNGTKDYRCFFKYASIESRDSLYRDLLPLVRISEMYYIVAECEEDKTVALQALNTVRANRGLLDLAPTANLTNEIRNEYRREFYGEGQLFFYYKRNFTTSIPNGASNTANVAMTIGRYCPPIPEDEIRYRN